MKGFEMNFNELDFCLFSDEATDVRRRHREIMYISKAENMERPERLLTPYLKNTSKYLSICLQYIVNSFRHRLLSQSVQFMKWKESWNGSLIAVLIQSTFRWVASTTDGCCNWFLACFHRGAGWGSGYLKEPDYSAEIKLENSRNPKLD